ncbi:ABC transporter permease [Niallia oryzisoli]|uniref:ABC transporter permease n=1 Tax=Niallia oryzisoli TaxID=1737571 RepID=UPI003735EC27
MSSFWILFNRLVQDYRFQYKVVKMVFDWTVMLYIAVPGLVIAGYMYSSWWIELPAWSAFIHLPVIAVIVYFVSASSSCRSFVKEADGVFLLKHKQKYILLKKWSFFYSLTKNAISIILTVILASPFLTVKHSFSMVEVLCFMLLFISLSFFFIGIKMFFSSYFQGWKEKLLVVLVFVVFLIGTICVFSNYVYVPNYFIGISFVFMIIAFILTYYRLHTTRYFQQEIMKEDEEKMRYVNIIYGAAPELEKPKIIKRNRPIVFPQSKKLFKRNLAQNGFYELFIKVVLRNSTYVGGYYKLLGVTALAMISLPPLYLKLLILMGFTVFIWIWTGHLWDKVILANPIGRKYRNHDAFFIARKKTRLYLTVPAVCFLTVIVIVNLM